MNLRSALYRTARLLGDVNAVAKGKLAQRVTNKLVGRTLVRRLWWR